MNHTSELSRLHASLKSCMGGFCSQRDNCTRHTTMNRSIPDERLCPKGQAFPELPLTTFFDAEYSDVAVVLESRRKALTDRQTASEAPPKKPALKTDSDPFVHRIVLASSCDTIQQPGPVSVFDIAAIHGLARCAE